MCEIVPDCAVTVIEAGPGFVVVDDLLELPQPTNTRIKVSRQIVPIHIDVRRFRELTLKAVPSTPSPAMRKIPSCR